MIDRTTLDWTRWLCLPIALFVILFFLCLGVHFAGLNIFHLQGKSVGGFLSAVLWVLATFFIAPDHKIQTTFTALVAGVILSWFLIGKTDLPDYSGATRLPTYITWSSGIPGFAVAVIANQRNKNIITSKGGKL